MCDASSPSMTTTRDDTAQVLRSVFSQSQRERGVLRGIYEGCYTNSRELWITKQKIYIYIYLYNYIYIYILEYIHTYIHIAVCVCVCVCVYTYYIYIYICVCVRARMCQSVCTQTSFYSN